MSLNQKAISTLQNDWHSKFVPNILENKTIKRLNYTVLEEPTFTPRSGTTDEIDFEIILKFLDVPCRANQSQCRNIEIFLRSRITYKIINKKIKKIVKYNTAVQYCKKNGSTLKCIMGYHYDGDDITTQYGHPIFHMQFKNNILFDTITEIEENKFTVERSTTEERDEIRVPTAQMDLFNTVVSLFADHLYTDSEETSKENTLKTFKKFLEKIEDLLIPCEIDGSKLFNDGPQTNSCMSNRWYPIHIS